MTIWTVCLLGLALVVFVGVLIPVTDHRSKLWLLGYGLVVAVGVGGLAVFYHQSSREGRLAAEVQDVLQVRKDESTETFIQAALTFLDKNKDLYPDTYLRAREICVHHQCHTDGAADAEEARGISFDLTQAGSEMDALLKKMAGIVSQP